MTDDILTLPPPEHARLKLPDRREVENVRFKFGDHEHVYSIGRYANGAIAEVFISTKKASSELDHIARDAAIVLSIALQHGVPLATLAAAITREEDGSPATIMGYVLDHIAKIEAPR